LRLVNFSLCKRKIACLQEKSPSRVSILQTYVALVFSIYQSDLHPLVIPWFMALRNPTILGYLLWLTIFSEQKSYGSAQLDLQFLYYKVDTHVRYLYVLVKNFKQTRTKQILHENDFKCYGWFDWDSWVVNKRKSIGSKCWAYLDIKY